MTSKLEQLETTLRATLGERIVDLNANVGELTLDVAPAHYLDVCLVLRDSADLHFEQLIDLCGVDYAQYGNSPRDEEGRFMVVLHLLSLRHNWRLRVRVRCPQDDLPLIASVNDIWNAANWFEREAFDLYGIIFEGHPDLRRILTDYGFIGHPFRKDFPLSGTVEMRYDPDSKRVIYQPVTIEPREITPRIVREPGYGGLGVGLRGGLGH
ncbi:MAG: NADH-quinone oxidoreductase subunit C [Thiomonas sp.]